MFEDSIGNGELALRAKLEQEIIIIIIIIMVILKCYFSGEHIALSIKKIKNTKITTTV